MTCFKMAGVLVALSCFATVPGLACCQDQPLNNNAEVLALDHSNVFFDIDPTGKLIVFSSANGDIFLFDLRTEQVRLLHQITGYSSFPAFSADGTKIVYATGKDRMAVKDIWVLDLESGNLDQLTKNRITCDILPRFTADQKYVLFARARVSRETSTGGQTWDEWDIVQIELSSGKEEELTQQAYYELQRISHSQDGIFYSAVERVGGPTCKLFKLSGKKKPEQLHPQPNRAKAPRDVHAWAGDPALSRDGLIAFISDQGRPFWYDLQIYDPQTTSVTALNTGLRYNRYPVFHPNEKVLYFLSAKLLNQANQPIFGLWKASPDQAPVQVTNHHLFSFPDRWNRDHGEQKD